MTPIEYLKKALIPFKEIDTTLENYLKQKNMRFIPIGSKMLIEPQETKNFITDSKIEVFQNDLRQGKVVEVSDEYKDLYPIGTVIVYSANAGTAPPFNLKLLIIDCRSVSAGGDIWFKLVADGIIPPVTNLDERKL